MRPSDREYAYALIGADGAMSEKATLMPSSARQVVICLRKRSIRLGLGASAASQGVRWSRWFRAHHVVDMLCQGTSGNLSVAF